jgi:hypothetical protein
MKLYTPFIVVAFLFGTLATTSRAHAQNDDQDLDKLLAPIALYPDALVIQIVQCAQSPYQVNQVSAWLKKNPDLKGTAAQDGAKQQGFDASFVAIVLFPQVVFMMADEIDWTKQLGHAFKSDHDAVFDSIQRLRKEAQTEGNLKTTQQQTVETTTTQSGQQVIVIQPANPQVVYVPQYNPDVVYTQPAPATSTAQSNQGGQAIAAGLIGFAAGVIVGAAADDDDDSYYYHYGGWGYHGAALCADGWDDYYDHRENMANDFYDHRENMADRRGDNRSDRWDQGSESRDTRQNTRSQNRGTRQDTRSTEQSTRSENGSNWQSSRGTTTSRGSFQSGSGPSSRTSGIHSGGFSGYQRGSSERASSARGHSSMGGRSRGGGSHRGGGGRRGGRR